MEKRRGRRAANRRRQEKRKADETRKVVISYTRKRRTCEATPIGSTVEERQGILYGRERPAETCVAPRHADASRGALVDICSFCSFCCTRIVFISVARGGGGGGGGVLPDFLFSFSFPFFFLFFFL